jgi:hypothetical protein
VLAPKGGDPREPTKDSALKDIAAACDDTNAISSGHCILLALFACASSGAESSDDEFRQQLIKESIASFLETAHVRLIRRVTAADAALEARTAGLVDTRRCVLRRML